VEPGRGTTSEPLIQVRDLVAGYGQEVILEGISFDVFEERSSVLGGSGCGKSTLLKHLVGLYPPLSGRIIIDGEDISRRNPAALQKVLRRIGVLYQSSALLGSLTIAENVALPIAEYIELDPAALWNLVRMKLNLVGLEGYENHLPSEISGGMRKRAGLARAMALNPKILFLRAFCRT
jgi:phospholipid/cholesterol/gamma-HCH transport system ATP-binding protein